MKKGDRLGHAIALGIDVQKYYDYKRHSIYTTKQDCLDNLVWLLYRSMELGVDIDSKNRIVLEKKARELLWQIYPNLSDSMNGLDLYYYSWKLRGDNPHLYEEGKYQANKNSNSIHLYYESMERKNEDLTHYRNSNKIASFVYYYHFDEKTKSEGLKAEEFVVEDWYVSLVHGMQIAMQEEIASRGICIECNPTSNLRISTIQAYEEHPILVFNREYLEADSRNVNMCVSINTDDIGVFDTSLENEYALLYAAICRKRHAEHNMDDHAVEKYLDGIRQNGIIMAFKKLEK